MKFLVPGLFTSYCNLLSDCFDILSEEISSNNTRCRKQLCVKHLKVQWSLSLSILLRLVHPSDGSDVSGVGIGRKLWSSVNRHDGSDGSGIGRKRNSSDPSGSNSVDLPTGLTIPLFDLHWVVTLLALLIPTPLPILLLVWTSPFR